MTVVLRRASNSPTDEEYMEVSYYFHDGECVRTLVSYRKKKSVVRWTNVPRFVADPERNKRPHVRNWIMTCAVAAQSSSLRVSAAKSRKTSSTFSHDALSPSAQLALLFFSLFFSRVTSAIAFFTRFREKLLSFMSPSESLEKRSRNKIYPMMWCFSDFLLELKVSWKIAFCSILIDNMFYFHLIMRNFMNNNHFIQHLFIYKTWQNLLSARLLWQ